MDYFVIKLINMSIQAGVIICFVLAMRVLFRRMNLSAGYLLALWAIPFFCMLCPWRIEIPTGTIPMGNRIYEAVGTRMSWEAGAANGETAGETSIKEEMGEAYLQAWPEAEGGEEQAERTVTAVEETAAERTAGNIAVTQLLFPVWMAGFAGVCLYGAVSCLRLKRRLVCSCRSEKNVYLADDVEAPFVFGVFCPRIYLPSALSEEQAEIVLAHERTHIRRKDHLLKIGAFILAGAHWFNPLAWAAFYGLAGDLELACDEETVRSLEKRGGLGEGVARQYAKLLVELSVGQKRLARMPIAFGEGNVKRRVENMMKNRKPVYGAAAAAVGLIVILAAAVIVRGKEDAQELAGQSQIYTLDVEDGSIASVVEDMRAKEKQEKEEQEIVLTRAEVSEEMPIGADGTSLDYGDEEKLIFHDYYGLFVYSMKEKKMLAAVSLKDIGCGYTQGDRMCEVMVAENGEQIYLHPMDKDYLFCYDVAKERMIKKNSTKEEISDLAKKSFGRKKLTSDCIDPDYTVFRSAECVPLKGGNVLYLEGGSGMAKDLVYVLDKATEDRKLEYLFAEDESPAETAGADSFRREGVVVILNKQGNSGALVEDNDGGKLQINSGTEQEDNPTAVEEATTQESAALSEKEQKRQEEEERRLFQEYEKYGVTMKKDVMYYNGERVKVFFDGYLITDEDGYSISVISRYNYYNEEGTVKVRAVRLDTVNEDGSVKLFGELADIVPYSEETGNLVESKIKD